MKKIFTNYKTTIPALLGLVAVTVYWMGYITTEQFSVGIALLTSLGLLGAKDLTTKKNDKVD